MLKDFPFSTATFPHDVEKLRFTSKTAFILRYLRD